MNIALMSHDHKKELMVQFCIAYCGVLSKHTVCATNTTGRLVAEATGLPVRLFLSLDARMQAVFALQVTQYLHRTSGLEIMREFAALLIDPQRYDVQMLPVDILMFENDIGLVAISHLLHVFLRNFTELFIGQPVLR